MHRFRGKDALKTSLIGKTAGNRLPMGPGPWSGHLACGAPAVLGTVITKFWCDVNPDRSQLMPLSIVKGLIQTVQGSSIPAKVRPKRPPAGKPTGSWH